MRINRKYNYFFILVEINFNLYLVKVNLNCDAFTFYYKRNSLSIIYNFKIKNMSAEEQAIQGVIDQIWDTYDVDKSGALDKMETKKFVQDTLGNLGSGDEFSDEAFDEVFATFDKDNSGTVEKNEMVVFIKQLLGGN